MTERSRGAPDPAEPSHSGAARADAPPDLGAVRRTDAIIEALAGRRAAASASRSAAAPDSGAAARGSEGEDADPAVRLLRALIGDVDEPAAERGAGTSRDARTAASGPGPDPGPGPGARRRGPRTIVALGVAGAVLASTGVAAAGDGLRAPSAPMTSAAGTPGDAQKARPEADATSPADRDQAPPPAVVPVQPELRRPVPPPQPGRQVQPVSSQPDRDDIERMRQRLERMLPPGTRVRRPGAGDDGRSGASRVGDRNPDDARRAIEDLRRQAQRRFDQHRWP